MTRNIDGYGEWKGADAPELSKDSKWHWDENGKLIEERPLGRKGRGKSPATLNFYEQIRAIGEVIQPFTVRSMGYQLLSRHLLNTMDDVDKVSDALVFLRETEGFTGEPLVPWEWVIDETREPERIMTWTNLVDYRDWALGGYRKDLWLLQDERVEVWSEKATIGGVVRPVLRELGVVFRVMHGFGSATAVHDFAIESQDFDRQVIVFYIGDYDCSGLCMSEVDLPTRFARYGANVDLRRLALTEADCRELGREPAFSVEQKRRDPRYSWFKRNHGDWCWELDALDPRVLRQRVREAIEGVIDKAAWERSKAREEQDLVDLPKLWAETRMPPIVKPKQKPPKPLIRKGVRSIFLPAGKYSRSLRRRRP
jgi:hypothetical protein